MVTDPSPAQLVKISYWVQLLNASCFLNHPAGWEHLVSYPQCTSVTLGPFQKPEPTLGFPLSFLLSLKHGVLAGTRAHSWPTLSTSLCLAGELELTFQ